MSALENKETASTTSKRWSRFATALSVLALLVSAISAHVSFSSHKDISGIETIRREYEFYYEFCRLEADNWQLSHIFALPDWYEETTRLVAPSLASVDSSKRTELLLRERAMARFIFTNFEAMLYEWRHSKDVGDTQRAAFLEDVLNYFTGRLLRNPRLLYQWSDSGGKLAADFEPDTRKYYEEHVLHNFSLPLTQKPDPFGPFPKEGVKVKRN